MLLSTDFNYFKWTRENPGKIFMYLDYDNDPTHNHELDVVYDHPSWTGPKISANDVAETSAHELGHILGLDDAYGLTLDMTFISLPFGDCKLTFNRPDAQTAIGPHFKGWMINQGYVRSKINNIYDPDIVMSHNAEIEMMLLAYFANERQYFAWYGPAKFIIGNTTLDLSPISYSSRLFFTSEYNFV